MGGRMSLRWAKTDQDSSGSSRTRSGLPDQIRKLPEWVRELPDPVREHRSEAEPGSFRTRSGRAPGLGPGVPGPSSAFSLCCGGGLGVVCHDSLVRPCEAATTARRLRQWQPGGLAGGLARRLPGSRPAAVVFPVA